MHGQRYYLQVLLFGWVFVFVCCFLILGQFCFMLNLIVHETAFLFCFSVLFHKELELLFNILLHIELTYSLYSLFRSFVTRSVNQEGFLFSAPLGCLFSSHSFIFTVWKNAITLFFCAMQGQFGKVTTDLCPKFLDISS